MIEVERIKEYPTPYYLYDLNLLDKTLSEIKKCISGKPVRVHYAIKANGNPLIIKHIAEAGLGADCVSGGEIKAAMEAGFRNDSIFYAGVGKTDSEIIEGIECSIGCFNVESVEELEVIAEIADKMDKKVCVALRVNPDIDAHTHHYITTGLEENKFGIDMRRIEEAAYKAMSCPNIELIGLHFHIGSQITTMEPFRILCERINRLTSEFRAKGIEFRILNVGGGLGIDYDDPDANPIPDFKGFFDTLVSNLELTDGQEIHCELGRSIVAQCGSLISRVTFVKNGINHKFVILDAGMSDLLRPALYGAHHAIRNLSGLDREKTEVYDVVGPICESSDVFAKGETLPETKRGDIFAIHSAGAYGESMASTYNMRPLPRAIYLA